MARVAFIGTGLLGSGMVEAMCRKGQTVTSWNRTVEKARALEAFGATVAASPEQAVASADRVHFVLPDDAVVDAMLTRIASHLRKDAVVIDHSTTAPSGTEARMRRAAQQGINLIHAPVFMSPQSARDTVGLMVVAGPEGLFNRVRAELEAMTGEVWYVGERPDLAAAYKIFGNATIFAIVAGIIDVLAMAKNVGVAPLDAALLYSKFKVGGIVGARADKMARGDFAATFELTMARKDLRLMIEAAGSEPLTVLPSIAKRMDEAIADGHGHQDVGVLARSSLSASSRTERS